MARAASIPAAMTRAVGPLSWVLAGSVAWACGDDGGGPAATADPLDRAHPTAIRAPATLPAACRPAARPEKIPSATDKPLT